MKAGCATAHPCTKQRMTSNHVSGGGVEYASWSRRSGRHVNVPPRTLAELQSKSRARSFAGSWESIEFPLACATSNKRPPDIQFSHSPNAHSAIRPKAFVLSGH